MKQFKTESKRILDLMINSIYTNKEIFLRELISNASDAIDKLHFLSLTDAKIDSDFKINISTDKENRQLIIEDNGIGMDKAELEKNLGTIAESGTLNFKKENEEELIGQFGVGFYSAFMVADKIEVISRAYKSDVAYCWKSKGAEGYTLKEADKNTIGTKVILTLKADTDDEKYSDYLEEYTLKNLIKKHSDYIHYPIQMLVTKTRNIEDEKEENKTEEYKEIETINSLTPLWKKQRKDVTEEKMVELYKDLFHDFQEPIKCLYNKIEGTIEYSSMLFIPAKKPYDFYSKNFKRGLKLYCNGVLIMDKCEDLLPEYLGFVQGVVDSSDLSLNISREMLQKDRQVKAIANSLEKKIVAELKKMLSNEREKYESMFNEFGSTLKFGIYNSFGAKKDLLQDIIMFNSSKEQKLITLKEYCDKILTDQKYIFYACGESVEQIEKLPQTESIKEKDFEILYFIDTVDEFVVKMLQKYNDLDFKSISDTDLDLDTEEEKNAIKEKSEQDKDMLSLMKEALGDDIVEVKLSNRLKNYPACIMADGEVTLEMERTFRAMPNTNGMPPISARKILEINANHKVYDKLKKLYENDKELLKTYTKVLFDQSLMLEGLPVKNISDTVTNITKIMA